MSKSGRRRVSIAFAATAALLVFLGAPPVHASSWTVEPRWVKAHEDFLASTALEGRGSATRDEAITAAYVASEFEAYGLKPAPGSGGYTQVGRIVRPHLAGTPSLAIPGNSPLASLRLLMASGDVGGAYVTFDGSPASSLPSAPIVVASNPQANFEQLLDAARARKVSLLIVADSPETRLYFERRGNRTSVRSYLEDSPLPQGLAVATLSTSDLLHVERSPVRSVELKVPLENSIAETTNAIGYLPGTDPGAGVLLISAHLDHLGIVDGRIMPGANDDGSGTTGVLELAHALASGQPMRRGILFVCYGSEELGGFGSRYFALHPPFPLSSIIANLELEMIGSQDPKLPRGHLMMTGFERSDFGQILESKGALVSPDPYPEEHFFRRSDNYSLALKGIVAHTLSGWAVPPTYHQPTDTIDRLDIGFMTAAIQSLIDPLRFIANGSETPQWRKGGRPEED